MQKLIIKNFGPIKDAEIDIHPFMVLIGPQASGKSTIAKLAYFFLHLSNDFVNILLRQDVQDQRAKKEGIFARAIRARFQNLFGSPELHHAMKVTFEYDNGEQLVLTRHPADPRLVDFTTDSELWKKLGELAKLAASQWTSFTPEVVNDFRVWSDSMDKLNSMYRTGAQKVFSFEREVVFIPANRSIVTFTAFLGEQPYSQYSRFFDRATEIFIGAVNYIRPRITVPLASLIREEEFVGNGNPPEGATELAGMIREILKGEYKYD